jgi:hypothetical protein
MKKPLFDSVFVFAVGGWVLGVKVGNIVIGIFIGGLVISLILRFLSSTFTEAYSRYECATLNWFHTNCATERASG